MPHAPTKDVTTTETITDKDCKIIKVTRDHDELGQHTHSEVVDKISPGGRTHSEATDVEKDDGEHVHKEVVDKEGTHGERIHQTVTKTDKGSRHIGKQVVDTDVQGKHIHEEEKVTTNKTLLGDGTVTRVVRDVDEPGHHHHEEVTTIHKDKMSMANPSEIGSSVTRHIVDDVVKDGTRVHEVKDVVEARGTIETKHIVVTDRDTTDGGHVHSEKVETTNIVDGTKHIVSDEKIITTKGGVTTVDEVHKEETVKQQ
eukprot:TRINITY_DN1080_c0_g1_i1.p2 TRINITY_DN1080_c0_g1~~TRINITY_DN1080_c0_g1_i1.p2  ORF type:complete len:256 (+),score=69.46 TRINITY_DN1080_c0_g1_i1:70-837(+)